MYLICGGGSEPPERITRRVGPRIRSIVSCLAPFRRTFAGVDAENPMQMNAEGRDEDEVVSGGRARWLDPEINGQLGNSPFYSYDSIY